MSLDGKFALVTGGSRGIGRGIAAKLASRGARVAVHYFRNAEAARETLGMIRRHGADGFTVQADVTHPEEVSAMINRVRAEFGALDVLVSNARPEVPEFSQAPFEINLTQWITAFNSQATAFLVAAQSAATLMRDNGRIIALTYGCGSKPGG